jgi:hypothetical protein
MNRQLLQKQVEILKNNIQEDLQEGNLEPQEFKLSELNTVITTLKDITEKQKKQSKLEKEYRKACKLTDSLKYHSIKNKPNANEILFNLKMTREKAQSEYLTSKALKEHYHNYDSKNYPGFLFLHKPIIDAYGICPFIYIKLSSDTNANDSDITSNIHYKRHTWLLEQSDKGQLYFDWFNRIVNKQTYLMLLEKQKTTEDYIQELFVKYLTSAHLELLKQSVLLIKEYINTTIKNKKIKDTFKTVITNLTSIVNESGINVDEYLSLKYNIPIPINRDNDIQIDKMIEHFNQIIYKDTILEYTNILQQSKDEYKYINKITDNLTNKLNDYILEHEKKAETANENKDNCANDAIPSTDVYVQEGKYFKKWSALTHEEKLCRFKSFSTYYVKVILNNMDVDDTQLYDCIVESYNQKKLKYKDFKWNIQLGIIEKMKNIVYENKVFKIADTSSEVHNPSSASTTIDSNSSTLSTKKSLKSIITKETEKTINEEIICSLIKLTNKQKNLTDEIITKHCDATIETIKLKLRIKKITNNDKKILLNKYDDMYNTIINQKYTE